MKLLIANRGEIACRVIRTAKRLGWQTVAVYSTADKQALHVKLADEAFLIGSPPPSESYLNHQRIIEVATSNDVTAVHPGYGFLSENPDFARGCADNSIVFVGPPAAAVNVMGLKGVARKRMQDAQVPVLPGINQVTASTSEDEIAEIGYPILIKPEAGGGGKGMKIVLRPEELDSAIVSARREALSSFGNDSLMIEKYLISPRHIEIQVFADSYGNCVHLYERDCSLQRRHQKIVEESPAPGYSDELRQTMGNAAVAAAKAIDYVGAGTVEFLLADDGQFYFMEMNTRLQVEHPVTEMITGIDLVEWQLRVAMGETLPCIQNGVAENIASNGHAIEVRLYAEDPAHDFLPVSGQITHLKTPQQHAGLRIDTGIQLNDQVGVFYDPMLLKLISWSQDREQCISQLLPAISELEIAGIRTNRDFLYQLISHPPFQIGGLGTDYLDNHLDKVLEPTNHALLHYAFCAVGIYLTRANGTSAWQTHTGFRLNAPDVSTVQLEHNQVLADVDIEFLAGNYRITAEERTSRCSASIHESRMILHTPEADFNFNIYQHGNVITLFTSNQSIEFKLPNQDHQQQEDVGNVQAPMSGKIIAIMVSQGDVVEKGSPLAVIEAMKMEHALIAPAKGKIVKVNFEETDLVDEGIALFDFEIEVNEDD